MNSLREALHIRKQAELEAMRERELSEKYRAVFCNPVGADVFFDITEVLCLFSSTADDTPEAMALKNLAAVMRARIGLADEGAILMHILNAQPKGNT